MLSTMLEVVVRNVRDAILILVPPEYPPNVPKSKSQTRDSEIPKWGCREFRWSGFGPKVWPRPYCLKGRAFWRNDDAARVYIIAR